MKNILLITISFIAFTSFSQNTQGVISFVEKIDMTKSIEEMNAQMDSAKKKNPERAAMMGAGMKKNMEEFLKSFEETKTELYFKNNVSLYKEKPAELTEGEVNQEENFMMAFKPKWDVNYYNKEKNQSYIQKDFMGKEFLIKDTLTNYKWKIVMEQKVIKGYPCMKAVKEDSIYRVEAWFTSKIPVSSGPKGLNGLPGMILEAKFTKIKKEVPKKKRRGRMRMMDKMIQDFIITAEVIEMKEVSNKSLKAPSKGQVVNSEKEYLELVTNKVKEMQGQRGKGGRGFKH